MLLKDILLVVLVVCLCQNGRGQLPSSIIDLSHWALTLPTGPQGDPTMISQPKLDSFTEKPYFYVSGDSVVFLAYVNGSHTSGSEYPRTELSERGPTGCAASWSNTEGTHTMTIKQAYTHLPAKRPEAVGAQILSKNGDILQVRLNNARIVVYGPGGNPVIVPTYTLGTVFTVEIVAANGQIKVYYEGELKYSIDHSGSGWYFKTGAYVQSNLQYDVATEYGQVNIYSVKVTHTD